MFAQTPYVHISAWSRPALAFTAAAGLHIGVAIGFLVMPQVDVTPPQAVGGFEVVDLSAFGVAAQPEPEPIKEEPTEPEPIEQAAVEPEPEPLPEPEPEPEVMEPEPLPQPVAQPKPKPKPKPVVKPKPKPTPKPVKKTETKPQPKPVQKPTAQPQTATAGSQKAFVPPSSTAAYLRNPKPVYPALAQRRGMQGVVLLLVEVAADGAPRAVTVKKGSGFAILDKAALRAVRAWRFAPAKRGGRPVKASIEVPIRFTMKDT